MGIARRPWNWQTWADILTDVAGGNLAESHALEFKRDDYVTTPGGRKEMAKDIAALAIDGGTLIIGIEEDRPTGRALSVSPVTLHGVLERIDQACAYRIEPPLAVDTRDIVDPADPSGTRGVILVDVPASPLAPHMVDGRYVGRDNRIARQLSDAEVLRLHQARQRDLDAVEYQLGRARELSDRLALSNGRLQVVAVPVGIHRADALRSYLGERRWESWLSERDESAMSRFRALLSDTPWDGVTYSEWSSFRGAQSRSGDRVSGGVRWTYHGRQKCRRFVDVLESGAVRVAVGQLVEGGNNDPLSSRGPTVDQFEIVSTVLHAILLAAGIAESVGHRGTFGIAVALDGVSGARGLPMFGINFAQPFEYAAMREGLAAYDEDSYTGLRVATTVELGGDLVGVVDELLGAFLRSLGLGDPLRVDLNVEA